MTNTDNNNNEAKEGEKAESDINDEQPREKGERVIKEKNRENYKYKYKTVSITLNHSEEAIAKKALEIAQNHFYDQFSLVELNTIQSFIKTIGFRYFKEFLAAWDRSQKKNGGTQN